jgi:ATP-binding cassette subfamily B protein
MQTIEDLGKDMTILLITHRLSTVQKCDQIFELLNGEIRRVDKPLKINNIKNSILK